MRTFFFALLIFAGACASSGTKFRMSDVDQLAPASTTVADATRILGKPNSRTSLADGTEVLAWVYVESSPMGAKTRSVSILFGPDNKMIRVYNRTETDTH